MPPLFPQGLLHETCIIAPVLPAPWYCCGDKNTQLSQAQGSILSLVPMAPLGASHTQRPAWPPLCAELEFPAGVGIVGLWLLLPLLLFYFCIL